MALVTGARPGSGVTGMLTLSPSSASGARGIEPVERAGGVQVSRRAHVLNRADREAGWPASRGNRALQHVVMVAVHRIPGQPEAGRTEGVPGRGKHAGHGGETVPG